MNIKYRAAKDSDAAGLISLIEKCYAGYEGCVLDVENEEPQLNYIATFFAENKGEVWVAEQGGKLVGCAGYMPKERGYELNHLYVDGDVRRQGLATTLCNYVENAVIALGAPKITLWTDTRFGEAHSLYEKRGYTGKVETRELHDLSNSVEFYYEKTLPAA
jgi:GNAT superfamily N-acetyltransferase